MRDLLVCQRGGDDGLGVVVEQGEDHLAGQDWQIACPLETPAETGEARMVGVAEPGGGDCDSGSAPASGDDAPDAGTCNL